ncbi:magnesium transporter MgtE N-terminal domain-containing protein [Streptomyces aurantiogriseus]|uniref:Magnesium transporter MgtE intracellular domain-containing protein n=1 Tax=Streptomyces aurantiogriseus TaxID=66870 RepID=A0A918L040_9ACTN|nr:hypothetical protein [Streptomyces aurantiogriseus]GGR61701.1 hypothetical protein GCM10010251_93070 [Streptomyces aurantiogriseus]
MSTDDSRNISVDIAALGESRVYQVAEGSMFIGDADATVSTARRLAAVPVQQAVETLVAMSSTERASVLASMPVSAAAARIAELPTPNAIQVLSEIDEQLAIGQLLAMNSYTARSLVLGSHEPVRSNLLSAMTLEQTCRFLGDFNEQEGRVSLATEVLKDFAACLPLMVIAALLNQVPPAVATQILEAADDRDMAIWVCMDESARLSLVNAMPNSQLEKVVHLANGPSEDLLEICSVVGTAAPDLGSIVGSMTRGRMAEFATTSDLGAIVYAAIPPEMRVTLMPHMGVDGLASTFCKIGEALPECIWSMMAADQSRPYRAPLAHRVIVQALSASSVDSKMLMDHIPQQFAAALWNSQWAHGVAREINAAADSHGWPYREAYERFSEVPNEHKEEVAWHLGFEGIRNLESHLDSRRWKTSKHEVDKTILNKARKQGRFPDPLV